MTVDVKICGLKTEAALAAALDGGADYIGVVFCAASPRNIDPATARRLAAAARGKAKVVALFVDPDDRALSDAVAAAEPDYIQLHGSETPERVADIAHRFQRPVIKAVKVASAADAEGALAYRDSAGLILFDAKAAQDRPSPGGNGVAFDWHALVGVRDRLAFMLAGGLNPDNVAEAIRLTGAAAVDVSSGVEARPGEKDPDLIRRFLRAAKTC